MPGAAKLGSLRWIPKGYHGTRKTIDEMRKLVDAGKTNMKVITLASDIARDAPERDPWAQNNSIFKWIQKNIAFRNDPLGTELLQGPLVTVARKAGDCDDLSILMSSLSASLGFNTGFKTIKAEPRIPNEFTHVYSMIALPVKGVDRWIPADPSQKDRPLGWEPPGDFGFQLWGFSRGRLTKRELPPSSLKGLGMPPKNIRDAVSDWITNKFGRRRKAKSNTQINNTSQANIKSPRVIKAIEGNKVVNIIPPPQSETPIVKDQKFEFERRTYYGGTGSGPGKYNEIPINPVIETGEFEDTPSKIVTRPIRKKRRGHDMQTKFAGMLIRKGDGTDTIKIYPTEEPTGGHFIHMTDEDDNLAAEEPLAPAIPGIDFSSFGVDL